MPLKKSCSLDAFNKNIAMSIEDGKEQDQAVAIAFTTLRAACGVPDDAPKLTAKEIVSKYGGKKESVGSVLRALVGSDED